MTCPSSRCPCQSCRQRRKVRSIERKTRGPHVVPVEVAAPVVDDLIETKIGRRALAAASGVSMSTIDRIRHRQTKTVRKDTVDRLTRLANQDFDRPIPGLATAIRIRSLVALGFSEVVVASWFGPPRAWVTYREMLDVLNFLLGAQQGPDRSAALRAAARGWPTPDEVGPSIYDPEWDGSSDD